MRFRIQCSTELASMVMQYPNPQSARSLFRTTVVRRVFDLPAPFLGEGKDFQQKMNKAQRRIYSIEQRSSVHLGA
jgi:hypothetical protein